MTLEGILKVLDLYSLLVVEVFTRDNRKGEIVWI